MSPAIPAELSSSLAYYSAHFMDRVVWELPVRWVCNQHGLDCQLIEAGLPGTYPTFIVRTALNQSVVIKFFGPLYDGYQACQLEHSMGNFLAGHTLPVRSPLILAAGQLDTQWSYLVFEGIPGTSIGQARGRLAEHAWVNVASLLGVFMRALHDLTADCPGALSTLRDSDDRGNFAAFLRTQKERCLANHRKWNDLPSHLLEQVGDYLLPVDQLVELASPPHLIHADLTADHLLGRVIERSGSATDPAGGDWENLAVIDWGDVRFGNILYELVALQVDMFRGNTRLLKICLDAYGLPGFYQHEFPRKALSMLLLHQFPMPAWVYAGQTSNHSLDELAEHLFGTVD
ncbi:MAG: aminoglycoside phosphotransferase family protein [Anaerolineae bacterium]|nr:aminoglycoside phosphotransferase family protein [Anaerolineae bacterium]